jgi:hypothetical protein
MWLLRSVVIVLLLVQSLWMLSAAGLPIALLLEGDVVGPSLESLASNATDLVGATSGLEVGLSIAAMLFFVVALVRLVRRTQGFLAWLLGFVCLCALRSVAGIATDLGAEAPGALFARAVGNLTSPELLVPNAIILGTNLVVGLAIVAIDLSDKRYWSAEAAAAL